MKQKYEVLVLTDNTHTTHSIELDLPDSVHSEILGVSRALVTAEGVEQDRTGYAILTQYLLRDIVGKLLTIGDAISNSPEQRKALKTLIQDVVYQWEEQAAQRVATLTTPYKEDGLVI